MAKGTGTADTVTAAQALIGAGLEAALEARRKAWFGSLDEALTGLAGKVEGFDPERLTEDEAFLDAVAEATAIALGTHRPAKVEALRHIVLNTAAGMAIDEATRQGFMTLAAQFSALHFQILPVLNDPGACPDVQARGVECYGPLKYLVHALFQHVASMPVQTKVLVELQDAGLIANVRDANFTQDGLTRRCMTPLGEQFLRFVSAPAALH